jgi:hypothetical protein
MTTTISPPHNNEGVNGLVAIEFAMGIGDTISLDILKTTYQEARERANAQLPRLPKSATITARSVIALYPTNALRVGPQGDWPEERDLLCAGDTPKARVVFVQTSDAQPFAYALALFGGGIYDPKTGTFRAFETPQALREHLETSALKDAVHFRSYEVVCVKTEPEPPTPVAPAAAPKPKPKVIRKRPTPAAAAAVPSSPAPVEPAEKKARGEEEEEEQEGAPASDTK